ncbi:hypothetical protein G7K71_18455 [Desulfofundulus sp. TPOSR]|uniref:DNA double-strand break repair nuclease NurA n=1 Tax=Desulfofundulus sp. TPOSR TaxID=2714340 RepID=UPI00140A141E|nr:DNA double-strand break repair nuclease NurA [Desulfofundulus sp. TPOSR]NHM28906.1 hypothetical protein [Desulfofundulus sp. TPOSR]
MIDSVFVKLQDSAKILVERLEGGGLNFVSASLTDEPSIEAEPPDPDRMRDDVIFSDGRHECCNVERSYEPYIEVGPPLYADEESVFVYFLDGSLQTCYWGDIIAQGYSYPVVASQMAVGVVSRDGKALKSVALEYRFFAIFPFTESYPVWSDLVSVPSFLEPVCLERDPGPSRDLRSVLAGKARERLHHIEAELASILARADDGWLVIDGDLRDRRFQKIPNVIGLAKSFSLRPVVTLREMAKTYNLPRLLRELPVGWRTPVLVQQKGDYRDLVFWYLRLWVSVK